MKFVSGQIGFVVNCFWQNMNCVSCAHFLLTQRVFERVSEIDHQTLEVVFRSRVESMNMKSLFYFLFFNNPKYLPYNSVQEPFVLSAMNALMVCRELISMDTCKSSYPREITLNTLSKKSLKLNQAVIII